MLQSICRWLRHGIDPRDLPEITSNLGIRCTDEYRRSVADRGIGLQGSRSQSQSHIGRRDRFVIELLRDVLESNPLLLGQDGGSACGHARVQCQRRDAHRAGQRQEPGGQRALRRRMVANRPSHRNRAQRPFARIGRRAVTHDPAPHPLGRLREVAHAQVRHRSGDEARPVRIRVERATGRDVADRICALRGHGVQQRRLEACSQVVFQTTPTDRGADHSPCRVGLQVLPELSHQGLFTRSRRGQARGFEAQCAQGAARRNGSEQTMQVGPAVQVVQRRADVASVVDQRY